MHDDAMKRWRERPLAFIDFFWPGSVLYDKQAEIVESVRDNVETVVHAANEVGKTKSLAWVSLWWHCTRFPSKVVALSSSQRQLSENYWAEVSNLVKTAAHPLGLTVKSARIDVVDPKTNRPRDERHYLVARVTNKIENVQGHHLPTPDGVPRVLFLIDEASGVGDEFYDAATAQADRLLITSNPMSCSGFLYRLVKAGDQVDPDRPDRLLRKVIHVDGDDSPNVQAGKRWAASGAGGEPPTFIPGVLSYGKYKQRDMTWDEVKKQIRLHGLFYEGERALMFPPERLDACEQLWHQISRLDRGPFYLGVDVAEGGRDLTVWAVVDYYGVVELRVASTPDTSVIPTATVGLMEKYGIEPHRVVFDRGGGGKEHADVLRSWGRQVRAVSFGEQASDPRTYTNLRAELYGELRRAMDPARWSRVPVLNDKGVPTGKERWDRCFALPPNEYELRQELAVLPLLYDNRTGRMRMLPKRRTGQDEQGTIDQLIGRSPDRADALALANWQLATVPEIPVVDYPLVPDEDIATVRGSQAGPKTEQADAESPVDRLLGPEPQEWYESGWDDD